MPLMIHQQQPWLTSGLPSYPVTGQYSTYASHVLFKVSVKAFMYIYAILSLQSQRQTLEESTSPPLYDVHQSRHVSSRRCARDHDGYQQRIR